MTAATFLQLLRTGRGANHRPHRRGDRPRPLQLFERGGGAPLRAPLLTLLHRAGVAYGEHSHNPVWSRMVLSPGTFTAWLYERRLPAADTHPRPASHPPTTTTNRYRGPTFLIWQVPRPRGPDQPAQPGAAWHGALRLVTARLLLRPAGAKVAVHIVSRRGSHSLSARFT